MTLRSGMYLDRGGYEVWVSLQGQLVRGSRERLPSYADGGIPHEPARVENVTAWIDDGGPVELTDAEYERAEEALLEDMDR